MWILAAAVNWTAVLVGTVTGATGIGVAVLGYFGARLASQTSLKQSETETAREREERLEGQRETRRELYAKFLDLERGLLPALRAHSRVPLAAEPIAERAAIDEQVQALSNSLNALVLSAPRAVGNKALELNRILVAIAAQERQRPWVGLQLHRAALGEKLAMWTPARRALIDEMRRDVAPDSGRLEWPAIPIEEDDAHDDPEHDGEDYGGGDGGEEE